MINNTYCHSKQFSGLQESNAKLREKIQIVEAGSKQHLLEIDSLKSEQQQKNKVITDLHSEIALAENQMEAERKESVDKIQSLQCNVHELGELKADLEASSLRSNEKLHQTEEEMGNLREQLETLKRGIYEAKAAKEKLATDFDRHCQTTLLQHQKLIDEHKHVADEKLVQSQKHYLEEIQALKGQLAVANQVALETAVLDLQLQDSKSKRSVFEKRLLEANLSLEKSRDESVQQVCTSYTLQLCLTDNCTDSYL